MNLLRFPLEKSTLLILGYTLSFLQEASRKSIYLFAKIFSYTLSTWIFEIVTSAIATSYGMDESCEIRFVMDTPNAFFGVFLFFMIIHTNEDVKQPMYDTIASIFSPTKVTHVKGLDDTQGITSVSNTEQTKL